MSRQQAVVLLTVSPEIADRFDWIIDQYELTQEQVAGAAVAMLSNMIADRDPRALKFMQMIHDNAHRSWDARMIPIYTGAD